MTGLRSDRRLFSAPRRRWLAALLIAAAAMLSPLPIGAALAQSLDELRASGVVGERFDGLLVARQSGAPQGVIDSVNAKRSTIYADRAKQQGVPPDQVGRVYAQQIMQQAPAGTWFLDEAGNWRQK